MSEEGKTVNEDKSQSPVRGRTFSGCWGCRLHKRRCDEMKPVCTYCRENNLECCYDVRLIWLDDNCYKRSSCRGNQLVRMSQCKGHSCGHAYCNRQKTKRRKLSRGVCAKVALSPPSSDSEAEEEYKMEREIGHAKEPATLNIRRLQIYDNHVASVYGKCKVKNYDQKHVNDILNGLLKKLDVDVKKSDCPLDLKQGPFSIFSGKCETKAVNIPSPNDQQYNSKLAIAEPDDNKMFIDDLVENKIYTILWLNTHGNMILSREKYCTWFLDYMKRTLPYEFCKMLEKIIDDANPFNISSWLKIIKEKWFNNTDWQTIAFTILTVVHGYTCPELSRHLESWFLRQSILQYSMYPLINFIVRNSTNLTVLYHCNELLNNNDECSHDLYQNELMNELNVLVAKKLVNIWRDRILQQLCLCEDSSYSCSQLKYWELQLKYNETFYIEVYAG